MYVNIYLYEFNYLFKSSFRLIAQISMIDKYEESGSMKAIVVIHFLHGSEEENYKKNTQQQNISRHAERGHDSHQQVVVYRKN